MLPSMLKHHAEGRAARTERRLTRAMSRPSLMASSFIPVVGLALLAQLSTAADLRFPAAPTMAEPFACGVVMRAALAHVPDRVRPVF